MAPSVELLAKLTSMSIMAVGSARARTYTQRERKRERDSPNRCINEKL